MKTNQAILAASLCLLSACANAQPAQLSKALVDDEVLEMVVPVGTIDVIDLDFTPGSKPVIGNRTVVEVAAGSHPRQFTAIPLKKGSTMVVFSDENGKVRRRIAYKTVTNDLFTRYEAVRYLLRNVRGVLVEIVDNQILVDGKVENETDREKVLTVQAAYYDYVLNLAVNSEKLCDTRRCTTTQMATFEEILPPLPMLPFEGPGEAAHAVQDAPPARQPASAAPVNTSKKTPRK